MEAQRRNAQRMPDAKLLREYVTVARFSEQPPIRVHYLGVLRDEIVSRGLPEPTL